MMYASFATFSSDRSCRYQLGRVVNAQARETARVFAFFGINPSTAAANIEDQTTRKWREFTLRNDGWAYLAANPFARIATDVKALAKMEDPVGEDNAKWLQETIDEADILVPCWGDRGKVPLALRPRLDDLREMLFFSGKPVMTFGFTKAGDPKHPLMLGYDTVLQPWSREIYDLV